MGVGDNGRPERRHVTGATRTEVTRKARELENIAARSVRPRTLDGYRAYIQRYAIPGVGAHRLD